MMKTVIHIIGAAIAVVFLGMMAMMVVAVLIQAWREATAPSQPISRRLFRLALFAFISVCFMAILAGIVLVLNRI